MYLLDMLYYGIHIKLQHFDSWEVGLYYINNYTEVGHIMYPFR